MDVADLEKYIGNVETRVTKALNEVEKRINKTITDTESRLNKTVDGVDECVKDIKQRISAVKDLQLNCQGLKDVSDLRKDFDNHIKIHKDMKDGTALGITKFRMYAFVFFAFVAMVVGIVGLIWNMIKSGG